MEQYGFVTQVATALVGALVGGLIARALRLPVLVGYLLAGVAMGPHTPGVHADEEAVQAVAKLGVAFLMFAVGVQLSLKEIRAVKLTAILGGTVQILACIALGFLVGRALGWDAFSSFFLGCAVSLSSTAVMMRILEQRGELASGHGSIMLGMLVVQDLSVVVMVTLLPAINALSTRPDAILDIGASVGRAVAVLAVVLLLTFRGVPVLLGWAARTGVRELFMLTVVAVCLATALVAHAAGLSLEVGAFLAGIAISESAYSHEVLTQVRPLRDLFASLFFVSVGMLLNPPFLWKELPAVLAVVAAIILGKGLITALAVYFTGWHGRTAIYVGLGLAQIGEFSFVLAAVGRRWDLVPGEVTGIIISAALITILFAPVVYGSAERVYRLLSRLPRMSIWMNRHHQEDTWDEGLEGLPPRVIILGSGRIGKHVSDALRTRGVPHVIVDYDTRVVKRRRNMGVSVVYGDASSDIVLAKTFPQTAELAVVTLPDAAATSAAVKILKRLAPDLPVLARVHKGAEMWTVRAAGADTVVHAEFEAAAEIVRQSLQRLEVPEEEISVYVEKIRHRRYTARPASSKAHRIIPGAESAAPADPDLPLERTTP